MLAILQIVRKEMSATSEVSQIFKCLNKMNWNYYIFPELGLSNAGCGRYRVSLLEALTFVTSVSPNSISTFFSYALDTAALSWYQLDKNLTLSGYMEYLLKDAID